MKWQNRVVYHSINPRGPNDFDTQAVEWLQIKHLSCSSPRAAALSAIHPLLVLCLPAYCQSLSIVHFTTVHGFQLDVCIPPYTLETREESRNRQSHHWLLDPRVVCPKIAFVLWRGILGMQISKIKVRTCNSNHFYLLIQIFFVNPVQKALIPSVK